MAWRRRRRDRARDIEREIENHLDLEAESREIEGTSAAEARRQARRDFGNPALVREDTRAAWGWTWLERLAYDVRHAVRLWMRSPGVSLVAIVTIALGIGASTAIFGQINAVFWTPLPVAQPEALRLLTWTAPRFPYVLGGAANVFSGPTVSGTKTFGSFSYPAYQAMRNGSRAFTDVACWADLGEARPVVLGELGFGTVQFVSGNYFRTLSVPAAVGRTIQPDDDGPETWSPIAVIGHRFWQRVFGSSPDVTQQTVNLNGRPFAIVGVTPASFFGMDPATSPDIFVPIGAIGVAAATTNPLRNPGLWNPCRVVARLAPGAGDEQARLEVERLLGDAVTAVPPAEPYDLPRVLLSDVSHGLGTVRDATSTPLGILLGSVGLLLAATCANIAGLLLARGGARQREIATRLALGAPRRRLVRQLVTESLVLSAAGGMLGIGLAFVLSGSARTLLSQFMPTLFGVDRTLSFSTNPDARVLAFAVGATVICGLLFGLSPALGATRVEPMRVIRQGTAGSVGRTGRLSGVQVLVAGQAALALMLLVAAGLFVRTIVNLQAANPGFAAQGVLYAHVEPRSGGVPQERRAQFFEEAVDRVRQLPGVVSASVASAPPVGGMSHVGAAAPTLPICVPDRAARGLPPVNAELTAVGPRFFETLGIPFVAGRDFTWSDRQRLPPLIVNEAFARATFGLNNTVDRAAVISQDCSPSAPQLTIVGVVRDVQPERRSAPVPTAYIALGPEVPVTLVVRTTDTPAAMIPSVRRAVAELNADTPTFGEATLTDLQERNLRRERLLSSVLSTFGIVTLLICCLGIYGMLSCAVTRRRAEISIRMAIGARPRDVVRTILSDSLVPVGIGIVSGIGAAIVLQRWMASLLFDVSPVDPLVLGGATAIFVVVAAAAAAIPGRAATRVDPVLALRQ